MKFIAITSCPTGIAHTFMAAESLEQAAAAAGHEIHVETQGAGGAQPTDPAVIAEADAVIFAADVEVVGRERFAGKPTVTTGVKGAINNGPALIAQAEEAARSAPAGGSAPVETAAVGGADSGPTLATKVSEGDSWGTKLRQWLMTGVSYLIPFVAAGGLLIALGFALNTIALGDDGYLVTDQADAFRAGLAEGDVLFSVTSLADWATLSFVIGGAAFGFIVPVLAGFIAFAMADRPGIAPGFVAGAVAGLVGAGFLGGIVGGLLAGGLVMWLKKVPLPFAFAGVWTVVVIPLLASLVVGGLMILVLGGPIAALQDGLTNWLEGLTGGSIVVLGVILGLMMAFDMGGPVNKVAYFFGVASLTTSLETGTETGLQIMAAVMAAGMVPPLALALATTVRSKLFTPAEQQNGKPAWLLGASFITEGAIPFAASDPLRVIPSIMAGSALTGGMVMAFGSTLQAPHGGIFVVPFIGNPWLYLVAIAAGTVLSAFLVITAKSTKKAEKQLVDAEAGAGIPVTA
jgi:PTS system fructose-specific IIC component